MGRTVIGIGVNVNNSFADALPELRAIATSLFDTAQTGFCLTTVLTRVLGCLEPRLAELRSGPVSFHNDWRSRCLLTDRIVTLNDGRQDITGICKRLGRRRRIAAANRCSYGIDIFRRH